MKNRLLQSGFAWILLFFSINIIAQPIPPTTSSSGVNFTGITPTSFTVNWINGNGSKRIVTIRNSTTALYTPPSSTSNNYTANTVFGSGEQVGNSTSKNYCVYNGAGSSVTVTGLTAGTYYYIAIFDYNTFALFPATNYYFKTAAGTGSHYTLATEPTTAASAITFSNITGTSFKATWTNGNGAGRIVSVREYTSTFYTPTDGNSYTGNTAFESGSDLGGGNYVCYIGTSNTVTVTSLKPGMIYYVRVFEYNGTPTQAINFYTSSYLAGTVTATNAPPTISQVNDLTVCENSGTHTVALRGITNGGETGQTVSITATSSNTALIPTPTINSVTKLPSTATLYYTPATGQTGTATIAVTVNDNAVTNNKTTMYFDVTVNPLVGSIGSISGTTTLCKGITGVSYTVPAVANATNYNWTLPTGATISGGAGTNSVSVNFPLNSSSGLINVAATNGCGNGSTTTNGIYVTAADPPTKASAGADQIVCAGIASMHANQPVYGTGTWTKASSPGSCFINDASDSLTNVSGIANGVPAKLVWSISNGSTCAVSRDTVLITNDPSNIKCQTLADFISDANTRCFVNATFVFTDASSGASSYSWDFGAGASPPTANTQGPHTVTYSTTGTKNVSLVINGGVSTANKSVMVTHIPGAAGGITSSPNTSIVCQSQNGFQYSVNAVTFATSYSWSLPHGAIFTGNTSNNVVSVDYSDSAVSGNITVKATNMCGSGPVSTFSVTVNPLPDSSFSILGNTTACQGEQNVTYKISGGNSSGYNWTTPIGAVVSFGAGSDSITVNYSDTAATGFISATPVTTCNPTYTTTKTVSVNIHQLPSAASTINGLLSTGVCLGQKGIVFTVPPVPGATGYSWTLPNGATISSGNNTDSVTVQFVPSASSGNFIVSGTNACGNGPPSSLHYVKYDSLPAVQLCLVTVDSSSGYNEIIWQKPAKSPASELSHFNIYREKTTNVDTLIGSVPYDSLSYFADGQANPNVTSYRYRISTVDTCGNESAKSAYHRTIHLVVNTGLGQQNLQWNLYEGQTVSFYRVTRDSSGTGNFKVLDQTVPGNNTSWSDIYPSLDKNARYRLEVIWGVTCVPTAKSFFESRSNVHAPPGIPVFTSAGDLSALPDLVKIMPNPASDQVNIELPDQLKDASMTIYNSLGELIYNESLQGKNNITHLNTASFTTGIYSVKFFNSNIQLVKKLVIQ